MPYQSAIQLGPPLGEFSAPYYGLAMSHDGEKLISNSQQHEIILWRVQDDALVSETLTGEQCFGTLLASDLEHDKFAFADLAGVGLCKLGEDGWTPEPLAITGAERAWSMAFGPEGELLILSGSHLHMLDTSDNASSPTDVAVPYSTILALATKDDAISWLVVGNYDGVQLLHYDSTMYEPDYSFDLHAVQDVVYVDGLRAFAIAAGEQLYLLHTNGTGPRRFYSGDELMKSLSYDQQSNTLMAAGWTQLYAWNAEDLASEPTIYFPGISLIEEIALFNGARHVAVTNQNSRVRIFELPR